MTSSKYIIFLFCTFALLQSRTTGAQELSLRTNLLWDAVSEPNLGLEWQTGEHWSVGVDAGIKAWPRYLAWDWDKQNPTHWRNFAVAPEVRYYVKEVFRGVFFGADALYTHYNVGDVPTPFHMYPEVENYRLQGSFWAGGLAAGYAWWPWQHWRLELEAGAVVGLAAYDRYECDHCGTLLSKERKVGVVPKLALNVAYNPVSREKHRARRGSNLTISGTDTVTVLTPPVAFVVQLKEVKAPMTVADSLARQNPWIIPIEKYRPLTYLDLTRPAADSLLFVNYELNSYALRRDYMNNAEVLDSMQSAVETIRDAGSTDELLLSIVGLASIEGPRRLNDSLSVRRARAVAEYIGKRTGLAPRQFDIVGKGEAWDWFRDQLKARPEGNEALWDIVFNEPDADARERKIKQDPELYRKVKEEFLADQRNSGFIRVYYSNRPDAVTEKWNGPIAELLKAKHYAQAVAAIQSDEALLSRVKTDAEAANAYGIALYFTALDNRDQAMEEQALSLLQEAARMGSECARHNLEGTRVYGPARKEYEAWMDVMKEKQ